MGNKKKVLEDFEKIKNKGEIVSTRIGDTGIGHTFEEALGKKEDNKQEADHEGVELKTGNKESKSLMTLMTKSPKRIENDKKVRGANSKLTEKIGVPSENHQDVKILHTTLSASRETKIRDEYKGIIEYVESPNGRIEEDKLKIIIKDNDDNVIDDNNFYEMKDFKKGIKKLETTAHISASVNCNEEGEKTYEYENCTFYEGTSLENLKSCIKSGDVLIDIRMGAYNNSESKKYGKRHDHGTAIRISKDKIKNFFNSQSDNEEDVKIENIDNEINKKAT